MKQQSATQGEYYDYKAYLDLFGLSVTPLSYQAELHFSHAETLFGLYSLMVFLLSSLFNIEYYCSPIKYNVIFFYLFWPLLSPSHGCQYSVWSVLFTLYLWPY